MAMGNFYLLNEQERWASVIVAKNACTTLKSRVLENSGLDVAKLSKSEIHNKIGYTVPSRYLSSVTSPLIGTWQRFLVVRDPIERFVSAYCHFALDGFYQDSLKEILKAPFDTWIDYAEEELKKPVLLQDEHLRCQVDYCRREDVDDVVPIKSLDQYFLSKNWRVLTRENRSKSTYKPNPLQIERLKWLYRRDDQLSNWITSEG